LGQSWNLNGLRAKKFGNCVFGESAVQNFLKNSIADNRPFVNLLLRAAFSRFAGEGVTQSVTDEGARTARDGLAYCRRHAAIVRMEAIVFTREGWSRTARRAAAFGDRPNGDP
jgi:hypothetical protein